MGWTVSYAGYASPRRELSEDERRILGMHVARFRGGLSEGAEEYNCEEEGPGSDDSEAPLVGGFVKIQSSEQPIRDLVYIVRAQQQLQRELPRLRLTIRDDCCFLEEVPVASIRDPDALIAQWDAAFGSLNGLGE